LGKYEVKKLNTSYRVLYISTYPSKHRQTADSPFALHKERWANKVQRDLYEKDTHYFKLITSVKFWLWCCQALQLLPPFNS